MVIVSIGSSFTKEQAQLEQRKVHLNEILNTLKCPNNCKRDMLIRISCDRKKRIVGDIYGACCTDFEKEVKPYLRTF